MTSLLRSFTRRYPLMTPRSSILRRLPPVPIGGRPFRATHGVIAGYYAGREHVSASLYWLGDFDPWVDRTLARLATPGSTALDIGANIGATSLVLARAVGPVGRVIAFEPQPTNAAHFRATMNANASLHVELHELALSSRAGTMSIGTPNDQPCMARLVDGADANAVSVPMLTLDAWLDSRPDVGRISVCKIDVEGHEADVFGGMERTIAAGRIDAFVFERHLVGPAAEDALLKQVAGYGYDVLRISKSARRVRYHAITSTMSGSPTEDFVAVRTGARAAMTNLEGVTP